MRALAGRTALVTGASRGVGRAIASALAGDGVRVFGSSRDPHAADWPEGVAHLRFDLSSPEAVERSWRAAGFAERSPDILVNNAGAGVHADFEIAPFALWERQIQLLLLAPMKLCHLALNAWSRQHPGMLVNVTSLATEYPIPYMSGYNAGKAGLSAFTESLLQDVDPEAAQIVELRLGDFRTEFNDRATRLGESERIRMAWSAMQRHVARSPVPEVAARRLLKALRRGERGVIRAGGFFQVVVASLWGRMVSPSAKRACNLAYYNLRSR